MAEDAYIEMNGIPCFSGGGVHCEIAGLYYAFHPDLSRMGLQYPHVKWTDGWPQDRTGDGESHFMDFDRQAQCYRFAANDTYHGKPAKWLERQKYAEKTVERELLIPGKPVSDKWKNHPAGGTVGNIKPPKPATPLLKPKPTITPETP